MIADRVRMKRKKSISGYVIATDADFSGTRDGEFVYIGSDDYVIIPHKIKGVTVTKTYNDSAIGGMFGRNASIVKGVATLEGHSITNMRQMFHNSQATTLDLSNFDTSNVTDMYRMFYNSLATTLDLSSFDTSKVTDMDWMFRNSPATTGYARTQADENKFNASDGKPAGLNFVVK